MRSVGIASSGASRSNWSSAHSETPTVGAMATAALTAPGQRRCDASAAYRAKGPPALKPMTATERGSSAPSSTNGSRSPEISESLRTCVNARSAKSFSRG
jgi:hypothetical protein